MFRDKYVTAVISAAGRGERMGRDINKILLPLDGIPILQRTLDQLAKVELIDHFVIVLRPEDVECVEEEILSQLLPPEKWSIAQGGPTREASTRNGLFQMPDETEIVVYHDGARPFVEETYCKAAIERLGKGDVDGVVCAVPTVDTIKVVRENGLVEMTPNRAMLQNVQTPQVFKKDVLLAAYVNAVKEEVVTTDDAQMVEIYGGKVAVIRGSYRNIKITTPEDLLLAELMIQQEKEEKNAKNS